MGIVNQTMIKLMILTMSTGEDKVVGGLVGDTFDWFGDKTKESISNFSLWLITSLFNFLQPFVEWGSKSIIVICILIYYCTHDKKASSVGMKWFFIYLVFCMIRGAIG